MTQSAGRHLPPTSQLWNAGRGVLGLFVEAESRVAWGGDEVLHWLRPSRCVWSCPPEPCEKKCMNIFSLWVHQATYDLSCGSPVSPTDSPYPLVRTVGTTLYNQRSCSTRLEELHHSADDKSVFRTGVAKHVTLSRTDAIIYNGAHFPFLSFHFHGVFISERKINSWCVGRRKQFRLLFYFQSQSELNSCMHLWHLHGFNSHCLRSLSCCKKARSVAEICTDCQALGCCTQPGKTEANCVTHNVSKFWWRDKNI